MRLSGIHLFLAFIALMLLRVTVGFHFFMEGVDKVENGFTAEYFLAAAKGPFAEHFHGMLDDPDGASKFCLTEEPETGATSFNADDTEELWDGFLGEAVGYYNFGDKELEQKLTDRRKQLAEEIASSKKDGGSEIEIRELEAQRDRDEASILALRTQLADGEALLKSTTEELRYWLAANEIELKAYFGQRDRESGFDRDGAAKAEVAVYVDSLRDQVTTVKSDRKKQQGAWGNEVKNMWDSYESGINGLAVDTQADKPALALPRPYAPKNSMLQWINRIIPWFDVIVGGLLILGLFTRLASFLGAGFLLSVIATQPPWIPGTQPTYLYAIELMALVVIFATLAGRMGGLDFFLSMLWRKKQPATTAATSTTTQQ